MTITVLTPTYNRGGALSDLYKSLQKQTIKDFEWLLVDDGSTDNTRSIVEEMKQTADFPIRYIYKENGGKHTALNVGVQQIISELTLIRMMHSCQMQWKRFLNTIKNMGYRIGCVGIPSLDSIRTEKLMESDLFRMKR